MPDNNPNLEWAVSVEDRDGVRSVVVRVPTVDGFRTLHGEILSPNGFAIDAELELPMGSGLPVYIDPPAGEEPVRIPATVVFATPRQSIVSLQMDHPQVAGRWTELEEDFGIADMEDDDQEASDSVEDSELEAAAAHVPAGPTAAAAPREDDARFILPPLRPAGAYSDEFLGAIVPSAAPSMDTSSPPAQVAEAGSAVTPRLRSTAQRRTTPVTSRRGSDAPIRKRRDVVPRARRISTIASPVPPVHDATPSQVPKERDDDASNQGVPERHDTGDRTTRPPPPTPSGIRKGMAARRKEQEDG